MLGDVFDVLFLLEDRPARGTGPVLLVEITQRDADRPIIANGCTRVCSRRDVRGEPGNHRALPSVGVGVPRERVSCFEDL